jgi:hypothetical protein
MALIENALHKAGVDLEKDATCSIHHDGHVDRYYDFDGNGWKVHAHWDQWSIDSPLPYWEVECLAI